MDQRTKAAQMLENNGYRRGGKVGRRQRAAAPSPQQQVPVDMPPAMPQGGPGVPPQEPGIGFKRGGSCR